MTPKEWMDNQGNNLPVVKKKAHRRSVLSKYQRELMIIAVAEMILSGVSRSDIVDRVHVNYGYSVNTIKDIIVEAQTMAAKQFSPEEIKIVARKIDALYSRTLGDTEKSIMWKLKAADQWAKLHGLYKPDALIQININAELDKKLKEFTVEQLEDFDEIIEEHKPKDNE
jgi:hypothetical protein